jgi:hypothetical protein
MMTFAQMVTNTLHVMNLENTDYEQCWSCFLLSETQEFNGMCNSVQRFFLISPFKNMGLRHILDFGII